MSEAISKKANRILFLNTLAFSICFFVWMINSVLVTFLAGKFEWSQWSSIEIGYLMAIPVLTGSLFRLPIGILTDKFGGKPVMIVLLVLSALPTYLLSYANGFWFFALCGAGFGMVGTSFAVGIGYTSIWFPKEKQGFALGLFGMGNIGAALTAIFAPKLLTYLTSGGDNVEGWVVLPRIYAVVLIVMAIVFFFFAENKKPKSSSKTLKGMIQPLKKARVWRFGLYYFILFGGFVAFVNWLQPIYKNVFHLDKEKAGVYVAVFVIASSLFRALGGYISDKIGARKVMYYVLISSFFISLLLILWTPENVSIYVSIIIVLGCIWGVGMAAVYKHIPDYFPQEVGVVGGMVGVIGGLGGFVSPIIFGYLKEGTGIWSSCWILIAILSAISLIWMHNAVRKIVNQ
ncbi:MAG: NarK/NasA family nitrate transporter [Flavobacteriaceae bacterium]|nr:NarK/NasA family nitrate transporter [Flavobacteriaceae bacterium]